MSALWSVPRHDRSADASSAAPPAAGCAEDRLGSACAPRSLRTVVCGRRLVARAAAGAVALLGAARETRQAGQVRPF